MVELRGKLFGILVEATNSQRSLEVKVAQRITEQSFDPYLYDDNLIL
jgi:hypothetical protein